MRYIYAYTPAELQYLQQRHRFGNEIRLSPFAYASEERSYLDVHFSALRLKNLSITIEEALCRSTHDWINTWYNLYLIEQEHEQQRYVYYIGTSQTPLIRLRRHLGLWYKLPSPLGHFLLMNFPSSLNWTMTLLTSQSCLPLVRQLHNLDLQHWRKEAHQWQQRGYRDPAMWDQRYNKLVVIRFPHPRPTLRTDRFGVERALISYFHPYLNHNQQFVRPYQEAFPLPPGVIGFNTDPSFVPRPSQHQLRRYLPRARKRYGIIR